METVLVGGLAASLAFLGNTAGGVATDAAVSEPQRTLDGIYLHVASSLVSVDASELQGSFSYTQVALSSREELQRAFRGMSRAVCGAPASRLQAAVEPVTVRVDGPEPYEATVAEMAGQAGSQHVVMSCACAGNQAAGEDIVNVQVQGVTVKAMAQRAGVLQR